MKTTPKMQRLITALADAHQFDLYAADGSCLIVEPGTPYQPLIVTAYWKNIVLVAHTGIMNGDVMHDPEVTFFPGYEEWVPIAFRNDYRGYYRNHADTNDDAITKADLRGIADTAEFSDDWAENIQHGPWVEPDANVRVLK